MRVGLILLLAALLAGGAWFLLLREEAEPPVRLIVLITPDTLRQDHVGVFHPGGRRTPRIDAWAKGAAQYPEARTPVPLTLPAHVTMLSGLSPATTGVRTNAERLPSRSDRGYALLSERLREEGWHTAAFVSAAVLGSHTGLGEAFDHYDDGNLRDKGSLHVPERRGADTVANALRHLRGRKADDKVFLWVHLFDPHAPYSETGQYAGGVRAVDDAIGTLLAGLKRDDACVLLAADHGEALGELGEPSHGVLLGDAVLRVPFLLQAPGVAPGPRKTVSAELADVAPTLAAIANMPWPIDPMPGSGRDLLKATDRRPSFAECLEAHRRYRWAQLIAVSDEFGTLVDAGEGRFQWLPRSFPGDDQSGPNEPPEGEQGRLLAQLIALYKQIDTPTAPAGSAPRHYGGGPAASPLLDPATNARAPDPYQVVGRAGLLSKVAQTVHGAPPSYSILGSAIVRLMGLANTDPGNPEIDFWRGMAHERIASLAIRGNDPKRAHVAASKASRAYLAAFEKGRRDATTVWKAAGVNVGDDPAAALTLLDRLAGQLPYQDCQVLLLRARLLRAIPGRDAEADAVCQQAEALCRASGHGDIWARTCAEK